MLKITRIVVTLITNTLFPKFHINHEKPARGTSDAAPHQAERPKAVITWEVHKTPNHGREEEGFPMEDIPPS